MDYKRRTIDSRSYWLDDSISEDAAQQLTEQGFIQFTPTLRHGRPLLNEVFWLHPYEVLGEVKAPTLIVHGTQDTLFPLSRRGPRRGTSGFRVNSSRSKDPSTVSPCTAIQSISTRRVRSGRNSSSALWQSG
ncbi:hypothetical protein NKH77_27425 [Streptomyces sp. M19]